VVGAGHQARAFLGNWKGKLMCDDYAGYKALLESNGIEWPASGRIPHHFLSPTFAAPDPSGAIF
jgi:hypothetical protein